MQTGSPFNHVKLGLLSECVFGFHIHYSLRSVACLSPVRLVVQGLVKIKSSNKLQVYVDVAVKHSEEV